MDPVSFSETPVSYASIYDRIASKYDATRGNRDFYRQVADSLVPAVSAAAPQRALDLACGSGFSLEAFTKALPRCDWRGADSSPAMLKLAQARMGESVRLDLAHAKSLPLPDANFDVVTCSFGFHWLDGSAVTEIFRVLKPGGRFVAAIPLRKPAGLAGGNLALRRFLLSRRLRDRLPSQGLTEAEIRGLFSGWEELTLRHRIVRERFPSWASLLYTLESRGSLHAIFGEGPELQSEFQAPEGVLDFDWSYSVLSAKRCSPTTK